MKTFTYAITDELGIHARPAGRLAKLASSFQSEIRLGTSEKMVDAKRIIGVMGLALKQGDEMTVSLEGPDEEAACMAIQQFLTENL